MKRVLIAGATGYLGRYLCAEYLARGWHVTALVRNKSTAACASLRFHPRVERRPHGKRATCRRQKRICA